MNKKDYKAIAEIFKDDDKGVICNTKQEKNTIRRIAFKLADYFEKESNIFPTGEFSRKQFLKDCGVD